MMQLLSISALCAQADALWTGLSQASKGLIIYGLVMALAFLATFCISLADDRTIRDVGVWVKPMKFMAATALFVWTTVWLVGIADTTVGHSSTFNWIALLIFLTSLFEVAYITYQGSQGLPSHYNNTDFLHTLLFGIMAIAAVGLTFSQAWLAWEIWKSQSAQEMSVVTWGVLLGLGLTFLLSTVSGFMLGGHQPPAGQGLPIVGWHFRGDIRPAHFLGVHAQQIIPLIGIAAQKYLGPLGTIGLSTASTVYAIAWIYLTWMGLST
jgi:hypothetical protein